MVLDGIFDAGLIILLLYLLLHLRPRQKMNIEVTKLLYFHSRPSSANGGHNQSLPLP